MSSIDVAKSSMGFLPAKSRPGCWNCAEVTKASSPTSLGDSGQFYRCKKGGFFVQAQSFCNHFSLKPTKTGSPS